MDLYEQGITAIARERAIAVLDPVLTQFSCKKIGINVTIKLGLGNERKVTKKKAEKLPNLLEKIRECIEQEKYIFTNHALDRVKERGIDIQTTVHVLWNGYEEKKKTKFDKEQDSWKYAIRGITPDELNIRAIVAFDENEMLVITVMHVL